MKHASRCAPRRGGGVRPRRVPGSTGRPGGARRSDVRGGAAGGRMASMFETVLPSRSSVVAITEVHAAPRPALANARRPTRAARRCKQWRGIRDRRGWQGAIASSGDGGGIIARRCTAASRTRRSLIEGAAVSTGMSEAVGHDCMWGGYEVGRGGVREKSGTTRSYIVAGLRPLLR